jgi:hypothetical protein
MAKVQRRATLKLTTELLFQLLPYPADVDVRGISYDGRDVVLHLQGDGLPAECVPEANRYPRTITMVVALVDGRPQFHSWQL